MNEAKQFCTFYIDNLFFGVDVLQVQEVIRFQEMTRVPLTSSVISGLINLRGQTVTAIDLRLRLNLPPKDSQELPMNVVVSSEGSAVSLLVDEIGDVIEPDELTFEEPPKTISETAKELIQGVYKLEDKLLLILDTEKTLNFEASVCIG